MYLEQTRLAAADMLRKAATLTVTLNLSGAQPTATVRVINESGQTAGRLRRRPAHAAATVRAFDVAGRQVYVSA